MAFSQRKNRQGIRLWQVKFTGHGGIAEPVGSSHVGILGALGTDVWVGWTGGAAVSFTPMTLQVWL